MREGDAARGYLAALVVVFAWSGFNIVSRLGGKSALLPYDLAALRFGVAGCILLPLFIKVWRTSDCRQLARYGAVAACGGLGYALAVYTGFSLAPAAHAGVVVNGGIPLLTALLAWRMFGQRPGGRGLAALLIALAGIALIATHSLAGAGAAGQSLGDLFFLVAALCWALAGLLMRHWHLAPIPTTAAMAVMSMAVYLPVYLLFLPKGMAVADGNAILLQAVYQGLVAATLAGMFYNYANHTVGPLKASLMLALVPGVTAVAAVPLLGEPLDATVIVGVLLVSLGAVTGALAPRRQSSLE